jgi:nitric oxide reductase activation protein
MRLPLNAGRYESIIKYRDDNSCLWTQTRQQQQQSLENQSANSAAQNRKLRERSQGRELAFSEVDTGHLDTQEMGHLIDDSGEGLEYIQHKAKTVETTLMTAEWDYRSHVYKQNWCRIHVALAKQGNTELIDQQLMCHRYLLAQLRHLAKQLQMQRRQRISKLLDGDELDPELMIAAMVALRSDTMPDPRIFMRDELHHSKSLSISVLMDLSESTNALIEGASASSGQRICELMADAVLLLGETLSAADETFSIAGFNSDGREQVNYIEYKQAHESFADVRHRLAGMQGRYSTRLGAAIRHGASQLAQQPTLKKILLVITDGAPSDIDVFDSAYLQQDSHHAVAGLAAMNIRPYCINLDPQAAQSIARIFGAGHYQTLQRIEDLPRVLSAFYLRHVRH